MTDRKPIQTGYTPGLIWQLAESLPVATDRPQELGTSKPYLWVT